MKKLFLRSSGFLSLLMCGQMAHSQTVKKLDPATFTGKAVFLHNEKIVNFNPDSKVTKANLLSQLGGSSQGIVPAASGIVFIKTETDELGFSHNYYEQKLNGIKIEGADIRIHEKGGFVTQATLNTETSVNVNTVPVISSDDAKKKALLYLNNPTEASAATDYHKPKPAELVIVKNPSGIFVLTWKLDIYTLSPHNRSYVYVDASNGTVVKTLQISHSCVTASVPTRYNANQTLSFNIWGANPGYHYLYDNCRPGSATSKVHTVKYLSNNYNGSGQIISYNLSEVYKPLASTWPSATNLDKSVNQVHWTMGRVYDYYLSTHNRKSFDNADSEILSIANFHPTYADNENAAWIGNAMVFGDGKDYSGSATYSNGSYTSIDIAGHEFTHAVTQYTANLDYAGESGALNESWSDIFGTDIEFYVKGTGNYDIGEEVGAGGKLRSMSMPNTKGQPDTYGGTYWINPAGCVPSNLNDYCGVHTNSGVANYWFFLLSGGGNGTNDLGNYFVVSGITRAKAAKIAYRALTNGYFTPTTTFAQARTHTVKAAEDLYGVCSQEAIMTKNAWYAVGVGTPSFVAINSSPNPTTVCPGTPLTLTATSGATNYTWSPAANLNTTTGQTVISTTPTYTSYTVSGVIDGCTVSRKYDIGFVVPSEIYFTKDNPTVCNGNSTTITGSTYHGGSTYVWSPSTGLNTTTGTTVIATPTSNITYTVTATTSAYAGPPVSGNITCSLTRSVPVVVTTAKKGVDFNCPIQLGTISQGSTVSNLQSNVTSNNFGNQYGQASDDIMYSFKITQPSKVTISHCTGTAINSYLYLLNQTQNVLVASNDDAGPVCAGTAASIMKNLAPGIYYIVSEGKGTAAGNITTTVSVAACDLTPGSVMARGTTMANPIIIGTSVGCNFAYNDVQNTSACFSDINGDDGPEIFYKITLASPQTITIKTCNSVISESKLSLLDINGVQIGAPTWCSGSYNRIQTQSLSAGTYYIVPEAWDDWGFITLDVSTSSCRIGEEDEKDPLVNSETFIVYPNPSAGIFNINYTSPEDDVISVLDLKGNEVYKDELKSGVNQKQIDLSTLPKGIYNLRFVGSKKSKLINLQ